MLSFITSYQMVNMIDRTHPYTKLSMFAFLVWQYAGIHIFCSIRMLLKCHKHYERCLWLTHQINKDARDVPVRGNHSRLSAYPWTLTNSLWSYHYYVIDVYKAYTHLSLIMWSSYISFLTCHFALCFHCDPYVRIPALNWF